MRIIFVAGSYPSAWQPFEGNFVKQFVSALARLGHECVVVKPTSIFDRRRGTLPPESVVEDAGEGKTVTVLRPRYVSFSSRKLGNLHTGRWTQRSFEFAASRAVNALPRPPDIIYGHFLYPAGRAAVVLGRITGAPSVVGVGEGTFWTVEPFGFERARRDLAFAAGFLAVASHIREGLVQHRIASPEQIRVEPNGVDLCRFRPVERRQARARLGLDPNKFLLAFVGAFDDLKGGAELVSATEGIDGVGLLLLGDGPRRFVSDKIVFQGRLRPSEVPNWLNAADIFVLPTREEGSCNAVIEALACGLPIITSNGKYMDDIVDDRVAIRVDPASVGEIRQAVLDLMTDVCRRHSMAAACLEKAKMFDIDARASRVADWMTGISQGAHQILRTQEGGL